MKIIVTGDVSLRDYKFFRRKMNALTIKLDKVEVVTGDVAYRVYERGLSRLVGADAFAADWCCENYYQYQVCHGVRDKRFAEMITLARRAVVFHDGEDKDTKLFLKLCRKNKVKVKLVSY